MKTVADIFKDFDGPKGIARVLGKGHSTASEMKRRKSIPVEYWHALIHSEKGQELGLTADELIEANAKDRPTPVLPDDRQAATSSPEAVSP